MKRYISPIRRYLGSICLATVLILSRAAAQGPPGIRNAQTDLAFAPESGSIERWTDRSTGEAILDPRSAPPLWTVEFGNPVTVLLSPDNTRGFTWAPENGNAMQLRWTTFDLAQAQDLSVVVSVRALERDPHTVWRIQLRDTGDLVPARIVFPRFAFIPKRDGEALAVPVWMGERTTRFRELLNSGDEKARRFGWEYPGLLSMQCAVFEQALGPGLYLAMNDTAALRKRIDFFGDGAGGAGVELTHYVETFEAARRLFELPYEIIAGANRGGWFVAAERYRHWALAQAWARNSRARASLTPAWMRETDLWVWNRGRSENVLAPAVALRQQTGLNVNVFWHWWHGCSYDSGFPEYLPPREGTDMFASALSAAHALDVRAMVYMNQRLWSMPTKSWSERGAERYAVKGADGTIRREIYNTFTKAPNASMCIGTEFWRDTYADIAEQAYHTLGIDAIYMDQACSSLACYDATHGHPLGGGSFWMKGFQTLAGDIRFRCADRGGIALAGEGCGEAWLPHLDAMLSLQVSMERYANPGDWDPIPFFHAVYHGYGIFFGNYASLTMPPYDELWPPEFAPKEPLALLDRKFARQFRMEHARSFVWGQQPTVANFRPSHLEDRAEEMAFVLQLARLRRDLTKYLQEGTMLVPPTFDSPTAVLDMSRLSIYAGQQGALREFQREYPLVWAAAWRAADGNTAISIVNIDDAPHSVVLAIPDSWQLPHKRTVHAIDLAGRHELVPADPARLDVTLSARAAVVYEIVVSLDGE